MRIFIIGAGAREHALAWKVCQSPKLTTLYINTPNASILSLKNHYPDKKIEQVSLKETDIDTCVEFCVSHQIELAIIGPETALALGLSDRLREKNIAVFGPSQKAAEIECSKAFSKDFMKRHHIPTAAYEVFTEFNSALEYLNKIDFPIVIKASGLASGKGVFLPESKQEAKIILENLLVKHSLGSACEKIIIEERLDGEEVSLLAFTDGTTIKAMPFARDHKRLGENNTGPNTGGMGAFAPAVLPPTWNQEAFVSEILQPTIDGLKSEDRLFTGVLYAGLMLTKNGAKVLEFNCRFGDPETQALLMLLENDLIDIMKACIEHRLSDITITWKKNQTAVCVVLASGGYPEQKSFESALISGLADQLDSSNITLFHAGTVFNNSHHQIYTHGGRVLGVTALADSLENARKLAYQRIQSIHFDGMTFRHDIGNPPTEDAYRAAGVDIDAGNQTVKLMTQAVKSTYGKEVLAGIGAFGGMFDASFIKEMKSPVLVASIDGIGTKVHLGSNAGPAYWNSLGHDIVNHSINDILVQGARPLFFLDYLASSKLNPEKMASLVTGMAQACKKANCALLGGETAEMPGVYVENMIDVAGAIVGIVERDKTLPKKTLQQNDTLWGLVSSGPHTNGYSLIRKVFDKIPLETVFPELGTTLGDALLKPHRNYLEILDAALTHPDSPIKALIHITGGGFIENIPRILPEKCDAEIFLSSWEVPPLYKLIQSHGNIPTDQMYRVFNMGIGMIIVTSNDSDTEKQLKSLLPETCYKIGALKEGSKKVILK